MQILFLNVIASGTIVKIAKRPLKQIAIVFKKDVLSKIESNMINKETIYSGAVIPEVSRISESTNIFIHIKSKIQIKGNSSTKLIGIKM